MGKENKEVIFREFAEKAKKRIASKLPSLMTFLIYLQQ